MTISLTTGKNASATEHDEITRAGIRSVANVNRVQVRSVNWTELAKQVDENTAELEEHADRLNRLETFTEELETRVSANEQATEDLVYLVNEKMITFSELGE